MDVLVSALSARHPSAPANGVAALREVSLRISAGEQVAIIGASGAGKTTLLHALACALSPRAGELKLGGQNPWALSRRALQALRGRLYLAPQVPPLPPRQRVVTAVLAGRLPAMTLAGSLRSLLYPADIPAAHAALRHFDLAEKLFDRVDRLSGGERQRVGLARALVSPASLWLIDEPLSALDPTRSLGAIQTLTQQARANNITLVATLHQVDSALKHFPRIIGLRNGELAFDLPSQSVTPELLHELYRNKLDELTGPAPQAVVQETAPASAAVMHCR
jgi:phosphonate transport system ATP-binding protein